MAHFIFNGKDSRENNVGVKKLPPRFKPTERVELIQVPGRNGYITQSDGTYEAMTLEVECWLKKDANVQEAINWLKGSGPLIFSDEPDKQYDAVIVNAVPFERIFKYWRNFLVQFEVQPFQKGTVKKNVTVTNPTVTANVTVGGNIDTEPIITLNGTGNFIIDINGKTILLGGIDTAIVIDSNLMNATESNGTVNANNKMSGNFPILNPGENTISIEVVSGSFSTLKVDYYEKWL